MGSVSRLFYLKSLKKYVPHLTNGDDAPATVGRSKEVMVGFFRIYENSRGAAILRASRLVFFRSQAMTTDARGTGADATNA